ncbi:hypothetical protein [Burkholderia cepacia]|uniref:hypothetical protein n=1 Tax=Burkholderia cepacia TaxID=292 RepID=UPI00158EB137|nr:hypothetical protein [Burkholderia cepacia]
MGVRNVGSSIVSGINSTTGVDGAVGLMHQMENNVMKEGQAYTKLMTTQTVVNMMKAGADAMKDASKAQ